MLFTRSREQATTPGADRCTRESKREMTETHTERRRERGPNRDRTSDWTEGWIGRNQTDMADKRARFWVPSTGRIDASTARAALGTS